MRKLLVAFACALACCAAHAVDNVKVYFGFTPAAVSYLTTIGSSPPLFMAAARAAFNQAVSDSSTPWGGYFTIQEEANYTVLDCCSGNGLVEAQRSWKLAYGHDQYGTDSQVIIDAIGGSAGGISGGTGVGFGSSGVYGGFSWINIYGGGMTPLQAFVHEMGISLARGTRTLVQRLPHSPSCLRRRTLPLLMRAIARWFRA